jgi:ankyrin repeat protein
VNAAGQTPLYVSAAAGHAAAVAALAAAGADVDAACGADGTALHAAAASGKAEVALALLSAGADPDATASGSGATPLHVAIAEGHLAVAEVSFLSRSFHFFCFFVLEVSQGFAV